nr:MAG TPA: hypothetical protein [Caudoviricetes sp.]
MTLCGKWVPPPPEPYIALLYLCPMGYQPNANYRPIPLL